MIQVQIDDDRDANSGVAVKSANLRSSLLPSSLPGPKGGVFAFRRETILQHAIVTLESIVFTST